MDLIDLHTLVSFEGFNWVRYGQSERELLQPQLERLGYSNIRWSDGERDSFGPLSQRCSADLDMTRVEMWYG